MESAIETGFFRYAAGVHPKVFIKALVRETLEAFAELENGDGTFFTGNKEALFTELMTE